MADYTVIHGKAASFYDVYERKAESQHQTHYCPGCGHGIIHKLLALAIDELPDELYPPDYFDKEPTPEQLLETVERFEEDLTDVATIHRPIRAVVQVGEAIEVSPARERGVETDPVMAKVRSELERMLGEMKAKRPAAAAAAAGV